jgi:CMP-N-acetylneuraminic acid synthetase
MKTLALIPARAGSRRLPGKNLDLVLGKPLIWWTIDAARRAGLPIAVSTDHPAIAAYAEQQRCALITRPAELATDTASSLDVVRHAALIAQGINVWDAICLLQPTSPLRTADDIGIALGIMDSYGADAVVSVTAINDPSAAFVLGHAGRLHPPQTVNGLYRPNGAIYAITMAALERGDWFYEGLAYGYVMPPERSLDIDWHSDMDAAREALAAMEQTNARPDV